MLYPIGKYLVVEPIEEAKTNSGVLVPENIDIETSAFKVVKVIESNDDSSLKSGLRVVVPSHMLEEVNVFGETYYLVMENHVIGFIKTDKTKI